MKKEANAKNVKYLEEYSRGDAEVLVVPVDDEGFIPYSKLRYYLRMNFWDSALEARIQSIAEYKSVALPYKRGHSVLNSMGTVPRGMAYSYYAV